MGIPVQSQIFNPVTGVFGTGQMQVFGAGQSGAWVIPAGIGKVRVRCFGGGASAGGGGGFALKTVYDLTGVTSVAVSVGSAGSSSSFGSYVSATGGSATSPYTGGSGVGGDINSSGGTAQGGGVGSLFGNGGAISSPGSSGYYSANYAGSGLMGIGAMYTGGASLISSGAPGMQSTFSIDLIGTGGGNTNGQGYNGGGGNIGGYPGGGGNTTGAPGMVIVEW